MLPLIQKNRFKRNIRIEGSHLGDTKYYFVPNEDSLTSSIFKTLLYLPFRTAWTIIRQATECDSLPSNSGQIKSLEFWPRWNASGTDNVNYVEPDVFLRLTDFDLIFEAKRSDDWHTQSLHQWSNQIKAYQNQYRNENRPLFFIALSGFKQRGNSDQILSMDDLDVKIVYLRWRNILRQIEKIFKSDKTVGVMDEYSVQYEFILQDLIAYFRLHGFYAGESFCDFDTDTLKEIDYSQATNIFSKYKITKQ